MSCHHSVNGATYDRVGTDKKGNARDPGVHRFQIGRRFEFESDSAIAMHANDTLAWRNAARNIESSKVGSLSTPVRTETEPEWLAVKLV